MKEIFLTQGKKAIVDDDMYKLLNGFEWQYHHSGYAMRNYKMRGKTIMVLMHRQIMIPLKGQMIDHINGNKLDNRKENLRICTSSQNLANSRKHKDGNTSQYKGVYFDKQSGRWRSELTVMGARKRLGCFDNEKDAALAYNQAALFYFGEYSRLNEI